MSVKAQNIDAIEEDEAYSFKNVVSNWMGQLRLILQFKKIIAAAAIIGAVAGLGYSFLKPKTYTATLTFIVEDSKASGGSVLSALSGSFGLDLGNITGGAGILSGDNVLQLVKSHSLIRKTLLTPYNDSGDYSLADKYADAYDWKTKWEHDPKIGTAIHFTAYKKNFSRTEDSLLQIIIKRIDEKDLDISKPDKKLGFFQINNIMRDEKLSKLFCERLLKTTAEFYIEAKTRRTRKNVERLQARADSIGLLLNTKTANALENQKLLLDVNPVYTNPTFNAEISSREKVMIGTIYAEIVKNLELSKTALIQETPTFQVVDEPILPLKKNESKWYFGLFIGAFMATIASSIYFFLFGQSFEKNRQ